MLPSHEFDPPPANSRGELIRSLLFDRRSNGGISIVRCGLGYELLNAAKSGALGQQWQTEANSLRLPKLGQD